MEPERSLTRREFEAVMKRASELAAREPDTPEASLSEGEVLRIAREVGLPERYVRKALTEVRSSSTVTRHFWGPESVGAGRTVPGSREDVARALDEFLVAGRLLQSVRRGRDLLQYRPALDWASRIARSASSTSRQYYVATADRVEIRLEVADPDRTFVRFEIDPGMRGDYVAGGIVGGLVGGAGVGVGAGFLLALAVPVGAAVAGGIVLGGAVAAGIAAATGRAYRKRLVEVTAEVEGILDRLEMGDSLEPPPPSWRRWVRRYFHGVARDLMREDRTEGPG